jgi:hypothetical protein
MNVLHRVWRSSLTATLTLLLVVGSAIWSPIAHALTPIKLVDLSYHDCPEELSDGAVNPGGSKMKSANCFIVTGTAVNASPKPVVDADIFGRIFDADNNPVMQNRNRLGAIPYVPIGESEFELRITVPDKMTPPLRLDKFKASGFASSVSQFGNIADDDFEDYGRENTMGE